MKILLADDNHFYRLALEGTLRDWGYEVVSVSDGEAALGVLLSADSPKLAIVDWMMPRVDGPEVCRRVRAVQRPEPAYILMLTAQEGKQNIVAALEAGADDYVTKPFDREELRARLRVGRRIVGLQTSETVVFALARAGEARSPYTQGHSERVTDYALALAGQVGLPREQLEVLRRGSLLHDIGKIAIPDAILNKPGPLTREEHEIIKRHPMQGVHVIEPLHSLSETVPLIRWHHERLDGSGYPDGLKGDAIPLPVRILAIADCYDAMASARPYRAGLPHAVCLAQLGKDAARNKLDPDLVNVFCGLPFPAAAMDPVVPPAAAVQAPGGQCGGADGVEPCGVGSGEPGDDPAGTTRAVCTSASQSAATGSEATGDLADFLGGTGSRALDGDGVSWSEPTA